MVTKKAPKPPATTVPPPPPPTLPPLKPGLPVVYGDSLAFEASPYLDTTQIGLRVKSGTAPCDWFATMRADAAAHPAVVVVAFSGNMATPCTAIFGPSAPTDDQRAAAYDSMLGQVIDLWPGARVELIGAPDSLSAQYAYVTEVRAHTAALAAARGVGFVDSDPEIAGLPRSVDGLHFCPGPRIPQGLPCPVDSPAARAYAAVIQAAAA